MPFQTDLGAFLEQDMCKNVIDAYPTDEVQSFLNERSVSGSLAADQLQ